jgi:hypothetical protein
LKNFPTTIDIFEIPDDINVGENDPENCKGLNLTLKSQIYFAHKYENDSLRLRFQISDNLMLLAGKFSKNSKSGKRDIIVKRFFILIDEIFKIGKR